MIRRLALSTILLAAALSVGATEYLVRLTVPLGTTGAEPLRNRARVLAELQDGGLILADTGEIAKFQAAGAEVRILDQDPGLWEYWMVGLRPDSDVSGLSRAGEVLHTEENWVLLRLHPGPNRLREGAFHIAPLPREPFRPLAKNLGEEERPLLRRPAGPSAALPLVQKILGRVTNSGIDATWNALSPPNGTPTPTRYTTDASCGDDASNCYNIYAGLGIPAAYQDYGGTSRAPNVIGTHTGAITPGQVYIVEGHLDDLPATGYAPGADDNGSGSVIVLEAAKAMSCYAFKSTVKFLNVTGEETGLEGSTAYANDAFTRGEDIRGVINMDMPGWAGNNLPATGEDLDLNFDSNSQGLGLFYAQCATDYATGLPVDAFLCPSLTASDHYPFWQKGYKAVVGITDNEGYCSHSGNYPYYHQSTDTIANCGNKSFFYAVVRTSVAALSELAEPFKITFDKGSYACGDTLQVIVGDRDLNTNASTVQAVQVSVWSTTESTPETLTLTEESANSMIFRGALPVSSAATAHGDGVLSAQDGDLLTAQYVDALDCDGATNVTHAATATFSAVIFSGVAAVSSPGAAACGLSLSWTPIVPACGGTYTYNIYRSTTPSFSPLPANRIASGIQSGSFTDTYGLASGTTYYYIVRAVNLAGGAEDGNTTIRSGVPVGPSVPGTWAAGAESGDPALTMASPWQASTVYKRTGAASYFSGYNDSSCAALVTPPLTLGISPILTYYTIWSIETGWDGGVVQISDDGGVNWATLTPSPAYPGTITGNGNACAIPTTTRVYTGNSTGYPATWVKATVTIPAGYEGKTVQIRWRFSTDSNTAGSGANPGWYVDDISLTKTQIPGACATLPEETAPGNLLATAQTWTNSTTHNWPPNGQATGYKILRGTPAQLPDLLTGNSDHCVKWTGAATTCSLSDTPVAESFFWYLVIGTNAGGDGSPGNATAGLRSVQSTGACP